MYVNQLVAQCGFEFPIGWQYRRRCVRQQTPRELEVQRPRAQARKAECGIREPGRADASM